MFFFFCFHLIKTICLKAHRQISKKWCFEKYCSFDKACQFSALENTPWWSYLANLEIDDKFVNKWVLRFIHQTMMRVSKTCWEDKNLLKFTPLRNSCLIIFIKMQKQSPEKFWKKAVLKFHNIHRKTTVLETPFFYFRILRNTLEHLFWRTSGNDQVYSNTRVSTQVNTSQHESDTNQHESDTSQHESTRVWHESTRVRHESTRVNTSPTRVNTSQTRANTNQNRFDSQRCWAS